MTEEAAKPKVKRKWPWVVGGLLLLFVVIGMAGGDPKDGSGSTATVDPANPPVAVTAVELSRAYQENEAKAQIAYEDKQLSVSGVVKDINLSIGDSPVISLKGSGDSMGMGINQEGKMTDVSITGLSKEDAAAIDKGKAMTFLCGGVSEVMGGAYLADCSVVAKP
jgi:tRNA_anti-like